MLASAASIFVRSRRGGGAEATKDVEESIDCAHTTHCTHKTGTSTLRVKTGFYAGDVPANAVYYFPRGAMRTR